MERQFAAACSGKGEDERNDDDGYRVIKNMVKIPSLSLVVVVARMFSTFTFIARGSALLGATFVGIVILRTTVPEDNFSASEVCLFSGARWVSASWPGTTFLRRLVIHGRSLR